MSTKNQITYPSNEGKEEFKGLQGRDNHVVYIADVQLSGMEIVNTTPPCSGKF